MSTPRADAYGDPLPPFALARLGTVRWRHRGAAIQSLAFSRDAATVYAAGGGVTALDVATGVVRWCDPSPFADYVARVSDPGGDVVATVGLRGAVSLRDAATGALRHAMELPSVSLTAVAASDDGLTLFAGGFRPYGALLSRDGSLRATLPLEGGMYVCDASFSPDGATLVTADCAGRAALWSVPEARLLRTFGRSDLQPNAAVFTPDGARVVVATAGGSIAVFDVATGDTVARWKAHRASCAAVALTPDGLRAVSLGEDGTLALWRLEDGARLASRPAPGGAALALSPGGDLVAFAEGPRVALLDLATFIERAPSAEHSTVVQALAVSQDGAEVVTVALNHEARWWSLAEGSLRATSPLPRYVHALRRLPEGDRYAVMQPGDDGTAVIDVAARALSTRAETFAEAHHLWWGRAAWAKLVRGTLTLTNARGLGHALHALAQDVVFTPDDRYAVFFARSAVTVWDLEGGLTVATAKVRTPLGMTLSPRGDEVAVWTATSLHRIGVPDGIARAVWKPAGAGAIAAAAYNAVGDRIAVATLLDARVLDVARGEEVARMEGHSAPITAVRFDRDGERLVTAGWDSTALVWSVPEALAGFAPRRAKKPRG